MRSHPLITAALLGLFALPIARVYSDGCATTGACADKSAEGTTAAATCEGAACAETETAAKDAEAKKEGACSDCACASKSADAKQAETPKVVYTAFGEPTKLTDADNIDAAKVLADVPAYEGKFVRLVGEVKSVCTSKGCWLKMTSPGSEHAIFVKFTCPVDGKLIPQEAIGKPVIVEGKLTVNTYSEDDARHYAAEEGKSAEEILKIVGEQKVLELEGPSALIAL